MKIIKEYCPKNERVILRLDCYAHDLGTIEKLFAAAENDFPGLDRDNVEIVHYGGRRYAKTYGIEFNWNMEYMNILGEYVPVHEVEYSL